MPWEYIRVPAEPSRMPAAGEAPCAASFDVERRNRPHKRRRLVQAEGDDDGAPDIRLAVPHPSSLKPLVKIPYPSPELTPPRDASAPRRLVLVHRPLPALPALPPYFRPPVPSRGVRPGATRASDPDEPDTEPVATDRERMKLMTRMWYQADDDRAHFEIFPEPAPTDDGESSDSSSDDSSVDEPNSSQVMVPPPQPSHPSSSRWRCFGHDYDLTSYNPPRPPPGRTFTDDERLEWLGARERCRGVGTVIDYASRVWTVAEQEEGIATRTRHAWLRAVPSVPIEDALCDPLRPPRLESASDSEPE